jgi:hypothetical protein
MSKYTAPQRQILDAIDNGPVRALVSRNTGNLRIIYTMCVPHYSLVAAKSLLGKGVIKLVPANIAGDSSVLYAVKA